MPCGERFCIPPSVAGPARPHRSREIMRVIAVGCEYAGVTSLLNGLGDWGSERGLHFHLDDHFSIPDRYHLSPEDQQVMSDLPPVTLDSQKKVDQIKPGSMVRYESRSHPATSKANRSGPSST